MKKISSKFYLLAGLFALLVATFVIAPKDATAATFSEWESNNTYNTANSITLGNSYTGIIGSSSDKDYYKITPTVNGYVNLNFIHTYDDSSCGWGIFVMTYNNDGYYLSNAYVDLNDTENYKIPSLGVKAGTTYYIMVENWDGYDAIGKSYTISTSFTSSDYYEKELNNTYATATDVTLGKTYIGNLNRDTDKDYYVISPKSDGYINLNFKHIYNDDDSSWYVRTYMYSNGEYVELSYSRITLKDNENVSIPSIGAKAGGKYYVLIERYNGYEPVGENYTLATSFKSSNYYEKELNNTYATATGMALGKTYIGNLCDSNDTDCYKIVSKKDGYVNVNFGHNYEDVSIGWNVCVYIYKNGEYSKLYSEKVKKSDNINKNICTISVKSNTPYYVCISKYGWWYHDDLAGHNYSLVTSFKCANSHEYTTSITKATLTKNGKIVKKCKNCNVSSSSVIYYPKTFTLSATSYVYDGKVKTPSLVIKDAKGKTISSSNYSISRSSGRKAVGTYTYKITFKGNYYSGTKSITFKIVPKKASISSVSVGKRYIVVKASKKATSYAGSGLQIAYRIKGTSTWKRIATTSQSAKITGLTKGKKYQVCVRAYKKVGGTYYYGPWSNIKTSSAVK